MFEKWESLRYPNTSVNDLHKHAFQWWHTTGFRVTETGPGQFRAVSDSKWGLEREAIVSVYEDRGAAAVELRMKANVTTEGVVAGGLALVLLWPVAVVGGAYSYSKYEKDALDLMSAFWASLHIFAQQTPTDHKEEVVHTTAIPQEEVEAATQPPIAETLLTKDQKLSLLEDRLARGEISEETYSSIKSRLDE